MSGLGKLENWKMVNNLIYFTSCVYTVEVLKKMKPLLTLFLLLLFIIPIGVLVLLFRHQIVPRNVSVSLATPLPMFTNNSLEDPEIAPDVLVQPITLEKIFNTKLDLPESLATEDTTTLVVTGDVLTARTVNTRTLRYNNFHWAWEKTADVLQAADVTFINLETPLVQNCPLRDDGMFFCGDPRHVEGLQFAGVDVINFANNHAGNWDQDGVNQTLQFMKAANIEVGGVNGPVYKQVNGTTFAFLGYNEVDVQVGVNLSEKSLIQQEITEAKQKADVVIVQYHWGNEYTYQPSSHQKELAYFAIDQGADLIVSNHPHWYQPVEIYKDKVIMYSHGNFIFDQMWSRETREGLVGKYTFYKNQLVDVEFLPVLIEDYGQPRWLEGEEKTKVLENLEDISLKIVEI